VALILSGALYELCPQQGHSLAALSQTLKNRFIATGAIVPAPLPLHPQQQKCRLRPQRSASGLLRWFGVPQARIRKYLLRFARMGSTADVPVFSRSHARQVGNGSQCGLLREAQQNPATILSAVSASADRDRPRSRNQPLQLSPGKGSLVGIGSAGIGRCLKTLFCLGRPSGF
jgi:hypothetical protein